MKLFILYRTDEWHSCSNREMIGVFSSERCMRKALKDNNASEEQIEQMYQYRQSQLNNRGFEFERVEITLNQYEQLY